MPAVYPSPRVFTPPRFDANVRATSTSLPLPVAKFLIVYSDRGPERFYQPRWIGAAHGDLRRAVPVRARAQPAAELGDEVFGRRHAGLEVQRPDLEEPLLAVRLRVEPAHERAAVQYRERVVPVPATGSRRVDLDPVLEPEELGGPRAVPDHGIEGGEQG